MGSWDIGKEEFKAIFEKMEDFGKYKKEENQASHQIKNGRNISFESKNFILILPLNY